jgi:hypothetical protein
MGVKKSISMVLFGGVMAAGSMAWAQGGPEGEVRAQAEPVTVTSSAGAATPRSIPEATAYKLGLERQSNQVIDSVVALAPGSGGAAALAYKLGLAWTAEQVTRVPMLVALPGARLTFLPSKPWFAALAS